MNKLNPIFFALLVICLLLPGCDLTFNTVTVFSYDVTVTKTIKNTLPKTTVTVTLPPGHYLPFEVISSSTSSSPYQSPGSDIRVLTDTASVESVAGWILVETKNRLLAVDYQNHLVILVFNGQRAGITDYFKIKHIRQVDNTVFIMAHFDGGGPTVYPLVSSQFQAVMIKKSDLTQTGELVFRLQHEAGIGDRIPPITTDIK